MGSPHADVFKVTLDKIFSGMTWREWVQLYCVAWDLSTTLQNYFKITTSADRGNSIHLI